MNILGYHIPIEKIVKTILQQKYSLIALQLPEGLKHQATSILNYLENNTTATYILLADPCFGACDLPTQKLKPLNIDFLIQIGHTPLETTTKHTIPTTVINAHSTQPIDDVITKAIPYLIGKKIGLVTTAQHLHTLTTAKKILEKHNLTPLTSPGDKRINSEGQILGCNFTAAHNLINDVDSYLFIGSGTFHPLGLLLSTKKPVIIADPYTKKITHQELEDLKDTLLRQRYGAIASAKHTNTFGILISLKHGQQRLTQAQYIKKLLTKYDKQSVLIALDTFTPEALQAYRDINCYISTGCPRIALDDYLQYKHPILTPPELEIVLNIRKWEDYQFDQITY